MIHATDSIETQIHPYRPCSPNTILIGSEQGTDNLVLRYSIYIGGDYGDVGGPHSLL